MLITLPIKSLPSPEHGLRVSIMSRHTLDDGVTPDTEITPELYDEWWPELAPPSKLIGAYYKRGLSWRNFEHEYQLHLERPRAATKIIELLDLSTSGTVTVLCIEDQPIFCHRRMLAEACKELEPSLEVDVK